MHIIHIRFSNPNLTIYIRKKMAHRACWISRLAAGSIYIATFSLLIYWNILGMTMKLYLCAKIAQKWFNIVLTTKFHMWSAEVSQIEGNVYFMTHLLYEACVIRTLINFQNLFRGGSLYLYCIFISILIRNFEIHLIY